MPRAALLEVEAQPWYKRPVAFNLQLADSSHVTHNIANVDNVLRIGRAMTLCVNVELDNNV